VKVVVDQAGHYEMIRGPNHLYLWMPGPEFLVITHLGDQAVLLQHSSIGYDIGR